MRQTKLDQDILDDNDIYDVKFWRLVTSGFTIIIPFLVSLYMIITDTGPFGEKVFILLFVIYFGGLLGYIFIKYLANANQHIQIAGGYNIFYFGDGKNMVKYNKDYITQITIYQPGGSGFGNRRMHWFYVFEITFEDGTIIKFSNMLIPQEDILNDFPNDLITYSQKSPFWRL